ncbi:MAG: S-layer homology domain-containing protein [Clostridia bacterium]|nr:S-layer homology domain-containing protein [Clostridia bacterium]
MKKTLLFILTAILILTSLNVIAFADKGIPEVKETEFSVASFNGTKNFTTNAGLDITLEDATFWLLNNKDALNLKYVSFLGQIAGGANFTYYNYSKVVSELKTANANDTEWNEEFKIVRDAMNLIRDEGIATGISYSINDHYANGFIRDNNQAALFPVSEIVTDDANYDYYNDSNYYTIVENNGKKYIIFQLELWPRTAVVDWFNSVIAQHKDKYAIVFTTSIIDGDGNMYTMWDWKETGGKIVITGFNSPIRSHNIANYEQPVDGDILWKYAFANHDNILAIISDSVSKPGIVTSKATNNNGFETALIASNMLNSGEDKEHSSPLPLIVSFSEDNKTITCSYSLPFEKILEQKTITLDKIGTLAEPTTNDSLPQVALQYNGANNAYIFGYEGNTFRPNANMTRAEACTIFARLILGVQTIPEGYTTRFEDVKAGDWFYNAVAYLDETGFFFRNKNTTYKPNEPITRAEFVDLANSASALASKNDNISFKDVPEDHFYYTSIMAAAGAGLVNGYEDETFRPDNTITRAEVVTVINRLLGLKVSEKTVSASHLDNEFVDIKTHWGRLNILMASNSNVHGDYYYERSLDGVSETASTYTFENDWFAFTVAKKNGKVTKLLNKYTGEDYNLPSSNYQFIYLVASNGANVIPTNMETEGNRIKVTFKNGSVVYMLVEIKNNFMTFELDSELVSGEQKVVFGNLQANIKISEDDDSFRIGLVGMSAWTNPAQKGYGIHSSVYASAFPSCPSGIMGAKVGITFAKKGVVIDYLKEILEAIDLSVGMATTTSAAYSKDYAPLWGDYWLITSVNEENIDKIIEVCKTYGIDQADIHKGAQTHRPGDFHFFNTESGTATEWYEKYGKKFEEAGIMTALHTYAYYIDYNAEDILTNPKWQKDLETLDDEYTLRKKLSKFARNIATVEDASKFDLTYEFFNKNSRFVLIDEEIIRITAGTSSGFINVVRGCGGTKAAEHEAGTKIYHLSGYFQLFVPKLGSDLFYHVADLTAKAYNEGGFGMIYLDAIDGLNRHTSSDMVWYYFQMFVQRIVSQCKVSPMIETSSGGPQEWNVRGRAGAYDIPTRGYNNFNAGHITNNKTNMTHNFIATLGWYDFHPDKGSTYKNTMTRTQFHNNLDYLGYQSIIYNMTMVYNGLSAGSLDTNPFLRANIEYYNKYYGELRKSKYFSDETIEKVKASPYEFKVIEKSAGEFAFLEMYYNYAKLGKSGADDFSFKANNPFDTQAPFIRVENLFSTLGADPVTLVELDENKTLGEQKLTFKSNPINITDKLALTLRVKGTGADGDAILISFDGAVGTGRADYFVDLSFDGWRDVILTQIDNGEYDRSKYSFSGITLDGGNFATYVSSISVNDITLVEIRKSGKTVDNAQIGTISACTLVDAPITNPTVTIGNETVTFNATLKSADYIEYSPDTNKAILYHAYEQTTEEITFNGGIKAVASGSVTGSASAVAQTEAPVKLNVVVGFSGSEITN